MLARDLLLSVASSILDNAGAWSASAESPAFTCLLRCFHSALNGCPELGLKPGVVSWTTILGQSDAGKMAAQAAVALAVGLALMALASEDPPLYSTRLIFPFFKNLIPDLGWGYVPFAMLVLVSSTNAVNLTDGLDGLAISAFAVSAGAFTALAYVTGHAVFAAYLMLVPGETATAAEIRSFCRERLAPYKQPRKIVFRDDLPKSLAGKVLRRRLREDALAESDSEA